ncbi:hypothetical protein PMIN06_009115 [Paraphaeosphaeria minitans]
MILARIESRSSSATARVVSMASPGVCGIPAGCFFPSSSTMDQENVGARNEVMSSLTLSAFSTNPCASQSSLVCLQTAVDHRGTAAGEINCSAWSSTFNGAEEVFF